MIDTATIRRRWWIMTWMLLQTMAFVASAVASEWNYEAVHRSPAYRSVFPILLASGVASCFISAYDQLQRRQTRQR